MVTTNLFTHPVFKEGGLTSNDRDVRRYALRKVMRNMDLAAELGAQTYVLWGGREGAEVDLGQGRAGGARPLPRGPRHPRPVLRVDRGYGLRFALEPKPNEPRGDIFLPTVGHAIAFIQELEHAELFGVNPEVGHEQMSNLNFTHGIAQALWQGKLFHIDLNGQHGPKFDQDLVFGHGDLLRRVRARSTCWRTAAPAAVRPTTARATSTTSRCAPRTSTASGRRRRPTCGPTCCSRSGAKAFRADPEVQEALAASGAQRARRRRPLARASRCDDLLADRSAFEDFDADAAGAHGYGFVRLDQLAVEHLLGAR